MNAPQFKKVRSVTLSVLKLEKNIERFVALVGPMHEGKRIDDQKEPAVLIHAIDMVTGEEGVIIASTVLRKELAEGYPKQDYIGRGFSILLTRDTEKRYNHVALSEVEVPDEMRPAIARLVIQDAEQRGEKPAVAGGAPTPAAAPAKSAKR